jgi:HD-GYP domain-containing protein (c-di-GMP phosphodiesterase class II)
MAEAAKLILDHHEWLNGEGYPRSKSGAAIPLGAQIIRIADATDILIQTGHVKRYAQLKKKLIATAGEEYPRKLLDGALEKLGAHKLFYKLLKPENVPAIFEQTRAAVGPIHVPQMIDAIGTALEVISQIIDMKHPYSSGHSLRVSRYAMAIALAMNLTHDDITRIKWAGLIHDVGKLNVSRKILAKRGKLTNSEYKKVKAHATYTGNILDLIPSLKTIVGFASSHHEHYDGSGYPLGLRGDDIPLAARILNICDAFDAMTSNRPYRNPLTPETACKEIKHGAGTQFDPDIAKLAIPIFKNLGL